MCVNPKCTDYLLLEVRSGYLYIWNKKVSSESFQKPFENFVIFLFLESFYSEKCKVFSLKLNKEKSEKIRDVTKSLYDVCKVDIYKDFLKLFYYVIKYLSIDTSRTSYNLC